MKLLLGAVCVCLIGLTILFAVPPNPFPYGSNPHSTKRAYERKTYNFDKSSAVVVGYSGMENVQLATGVINFHSVYVASAGINSQLILYDSNKFSLGNSTFNITSSARGENTTVIERIEYHYQSSTQGIVYTSTCIACAAPWGPPLLRFTYERER